jgi:hypothetical protein
VIDVAEAQLDDQEVFEQGGEASQGERSCPGAVAIGHVVRIEPDILALIPGGVLG